MYATEIQQKYERIVMEVELQYSEKDAPNAVQHYYLMASLIVARSFERFYKHFGETFIDDYIAGIGKDEYLGLGMMDDFEIETIYLWNSFCTNMKNSRPNHNK
jgi:hypothetical protein